MSDCRFGQPTLRTRSPGPAAAALSTAVIAGLSITHMGTPSITTTRNIAVRIVVLVALPLLPSISSLPMSYALVSAANHMAGVSDREPGGRKKGRPSRPHSIQDIAAIPHGRPKRIIDRARTL